MLSRGEKIISRLVLSVVVIYERASSDDSHDGQP